jgi:hypothetical protein
MLANKSYLPNSESGTPGGPATAPGITFICILPTPTGKSEIREADRSGSHVCGRGGILPFDQYPESGLWRAGIASAEHDFALKFYFTKTTGDFFKGRAKNCRQTQTLVDKPRLLSTKT